MPVSNPQRVIQRFGQARLVLLLNGQYELIGGTDADRNDAFAWTSIFAHDIVFTPYPRETTIVCRCRRSRFASRFQPM